MDKPIGKLTLVYPPAAEDMIMELMLKADPPLTGLTTSTAEGHGHDFSKASTSERVRGRIRRGVLTVVAPRERFAALLEDIRINAAIVNLVYWIEPVEAFGRLVPCEPRAADATASLVAAE
jgi:hypothetical protein